MTTVVWIHLFMTKMVTRQRLAQDARNETVELVVYMQKINMSVVDFGLNSLFWLSCKDLTDV